jgi:hypothetical protein
MIGASLENLLLPCASRMVGEYEGTIVGGSVAEGMIVVYSIVEYEG